jgi:hypothetical protein
MPNSLIGYKISFAFFARNLHFNLTCRCSSLFSAHEKDFALAFHPRFYGFGAVGGDVKLNPRSR